MRKGTSPSNRAASRVTSIVKRASAFYDQHPRLSSGAALALSLLALANATDWRFILILAACFAAIALPALIARRKP